MNLEEFETITGPGSDFYVRLRNSLGNGNLSGFKAEMELEGVFLEFPVKVYIQDPGFSIPTADLKGVSDPGLVQYLARSSGQRHEETGLRLTMREGNKTFIREMTF